MKKVIFIVLSLMALGSLSSCFQHRVCATYTMDTSEKENILEKTNDSEAL